MIKHLELKTYEYYDIKVTVEINYDRKEISLVEKRGVADSYFTDIKPKNYIFI